MLGDLRDSTLSITVSGGGGMSRKRASSIADMDRKGVHMAGQIDANELAASVEGMVDHAELVNLEGAEDSVGQGDVEVIDIDDVTVDMRWMPHKDLGYVIVTLDALENDGDDDAEEKDTVKAVTLQSTGQFVTVPSGVRLLRAQCPPDPVRVTDVNSLMITNDAEILDLLHKRFEKDQIYTYAGPIVISVNPFQNLNLNTQELKEKYREASYEANTPHVFALADAAWREMVDNGTDHSVLVSGESGAGKTEATKLVLSYLTYVSEQVSSSGNSKGKETAEKLVQCGPLLEAFGNAKTLRNDNSSRFGKFLKVLFKRDGTICGGRVVTYLLEKSRIVRQSPEERSYHIFYQLLSTKDTELRRSLFLDEAAESTYMVNGVLPVSGIDDRADFSATMESMHTIGLTSDQKQAVLRATAAVLHLGCITFGGDDVAVTTSPAAVTHVASLLMVDEKELVKCMTTVSRFMRDEVVVSPITSKEAIAVRDSMAMTLFDAIFSFIVQQVNTTLDSGDDHAHEISVLDIFGFEVFEENLFEQMCINYANEKLQQHFCLDAIKNEQKEYESEGIPWTSIPFQDNAACVEMFERKHTGIIALIHEACKLARATDLTLFESLKENFKGGPHTVFDRRARDTFKIHHFAGDVEYTVLGFLEKSKNKLGNDPVKMLQASLCKVVSSLFQQGDSAKTSGSLGSAFKTQLGQLMQDLGRTNCHYIRCIKPNALKRAHYFDRLSSLRQLRCAGVMEAAAIRKQGFPVRLTFHSFMARFGHTVFSGSIPEGLNERIAAEPEAAANVTGLQAMLVGDTSGVLVEGQYVVGKSKVLLRDDQFGWLNQRRIKVVKESVLKLQRNVRARRDREVFALKLAAIKKAVEVMQRVQRMLMRKAAYRMAKNAVVLLQKVGRRAMLHAAWLKTYAAILQKRADEELRLKREEEERVKREEKERQRKEVEERKRLMEEARMKEEAEELARKQERDDRLREEQDRRDQLRKEREEERLAAEKAEAEAKAAAAVVKPVVRVKIVLLRGEAKMEYTIVPDANNKVCVKNVKSGKIYECSLKRIPKAPPGEYIALFKADHTNNQYGLRIKLKK